MLQGASVCNRANVTAASTSKKQAVHVPPPSQLLARRKLLSFAVSAPAFLGLSLVPAARAAEIVISNDEINSVVEGRSSVIPALTVPQYVQAIRSNQGRAFQIIRDLMDRSKYKEIAESLTFGEFDVVYQSAFYLPWALLKVNAGAAQTCYEEYLALSKAIKELERLCVGAARNQVEDEELEMGVEAVERQVTALLKAVPVGIA